MLRQGFFWKWNACEAFQCCFPLQIPSFRKAWKAVRAWAIFFAFKAMSYEDEYGEEPAADKYPFLIELWKETQDSDLVCDQLLHILVAG
jgi:hypothetical protein